MGKPKKIAKRKKPKFFGKLKGLRSLDISEFHKLVLDYQKPTFDIITYSAQVQRMLSQTFNAERTIRIEDGTNTIEATIMQAALGSNGLATFHLVADKFIFGPVTNAARKKKPRLKTADEFHTDEYLDLIKQIPSHARHRVERTPEGATFRDFSSLKNEGVFIAAVTDTPEFSPDVGVTPLPETLQHFKTGVGYGHSPAEALRNALAEYETEPKP